MKDKIDNKKSKKVELEITYGDNKLLKWSTLPRSIGLKTER